MWQSQILENCICCIDNWINKTNLDQRQNIWYFNKGNITFCALYDAPELAVSFCENCISGKNLVLNL